MLIRFLNSPDPEKTEEHFSLVDFFFSLCLSLFSFFPVCNVHTLDASLMQIIS